MDHPCALVDANDAHGRRSSEVKRPRADLGERVGGHEGPRCAFPVVRGRTERGGCSFDAGEDLGDGEGLANDPCRHDESSFVLCVEQGVRRPRHGPCIAEALFARDGVRAAAVYDEGTRPACALLEHIGADEHGGGFERIAGKACSARGLGCGYSGEDEAKIKQGLVLFDTAVHACGHETAGNSGWFNWKDVARLGWGAGGDEAAVKVEAECRTGPHDNATCVTD